MHSFHMGPGGGNPQAAQALTILRGLTRALEEACTDRPGVYVNEVKKLCLAVEAAEEVRRRLTRANQQPPENLVRRELQHQIRSFALMRALAEQQVAEALVLADRLYAQQTGQHPDWSQAGVLTEVMERMAGEIPDDELLEGLAVQPLTVVMVEQADKLEQLEALLPFCLDHSARLLYQTQRKHEAG